MPPRPSMRPKKTPEIIPILSGIRSVAYISTDGAPHTVWADFNENDDQYFGIPFWGTDSKEFFITREPRIQNTLELYSVSAIDGSKKHIYTEVYISLPAGHNGRAGLDQIYKHLNRKELEDFKAWLRYLCDK